MLHLLLAGCAASAEPDALAVVGLELGEMTWASAEAGPIHGALGDAFVLAHRGELDGRGIARLEAAVREAMADGEITTHEASAIRESVPVVEVEWGPESRAVYAHQQRGEELARERYEKLEAERRAQGRSFEGWTSEVLAGRLDAIGWPGAQCEAQEVFAAVQCEATRDDRQLSVRLTDESRSRWEVPRSPEAAARSQRAADHDGLRVLTVSVRVGEARDLEAARAVLAQLLGS